MREEEVLFVLKKNNEFKQFIRNKDELIDTIIQFPQHADALINIVLTDQQEFGRLFPFNFYWRATAKKLPQYAEELIKIVLTNSKEFRRLIPTNYYLLMTAEFFPDHKDEIINRILENPKDFEELLLCVSSELLAKTVKVFPKHADVLQQPSFEKVQDVLKSRKQIQRSVNEFKNALKMGNSFFSRVPTPVFIKIAGATCNPEVHDEKTAEGIAAEILASPGQRRG